MRSGCLLCLLAFAGCAIPEREVALPNHEAAAGRKLYVSKCAKCHKFYDPAKYSETEWQMWMARMSKKAKLRPDQAEILGRYIEDNLRRPQRTNNPTGAR